MGKRSKSKVRRESKNICTCSFYRVSSKYFFSQMGQTILPSGISCPQMMHVCAVFETDSVDCGNGSACNSFFVVFLFNMIPLSFV